MNDPVYSETIHSPDPFGKRAEQTIGSSSIYRLCEEIIALREVNNRQHKMFEQSVAKARDALQNSFNSFAADTQRAYQQLRQEINGEKRFSLTLLNELLDLGFDMEHLAKSRPDHSGEDALARWADGVLVQARKVQAILQQLGIHPYDAVIGSAYNPALHERVGSRTVEGMEALHVIEQREHGYASQQPEFVLRRAKVVISE
jgi:molecular chaperone GrpE (heat shock protein)